jgi:hypothetical protein
VRLLAVLALVCLPCAALAQGKPRTIEDCERIDEPLAYNACLASFGPRQGQRNFVPAGEAAAESAQRTAPARGMKGAVSSGRRKDGKSFVIFDVGPRKR